MPLRRFAIEKLPDNFPKVWDLLNFHVSQIGREYNFRDASYPRALFHWFKYGSVTKFDDVVNYKGKIYAIIRRGRAYIINCNSSTVSRVVSEAIVTGTSLEKQKHLVGSDRELYLLVRNSPRDEIFFNVYRLNEEEEQNKWDEVDSLDGKILFVTTTSCFLASAPDFPGWKGDCIVFPEDSLPTYLRGTHPDMRFFSRVDEELQIGVLYLGDNDVTKLIRSYRGYSDLFWPPPPWLQQAECKSRNNRGL